MKKLIQKIRIKTVFLFLSLVLWWRSSPISDYFFPTNTEQDINNYWDLKKIIYAICITLAILSGEYKNKLQKFLSLVFIGVLAEDISDRLQKITYLEWTDYIVFDLVLITSFFITYKDVFNNKVFNDYFSRNFRC